MLWAALPFKFDIARLAFAAAVAVLAISPILWLINTWLDPAFDAHGFWFFCACAALAAWSASSPLRHDRLALMFAATDTDEFNADVLNFIEGRKIDGAGGSGGNARR